MKKLSNLILLIGSLAMVGLLAYHKEPPKERIAFTFPSATARWEIPHMETGTGFIALHPVTTSEYQRFANATQYKTWREQHHATPNFRSEEEAAPVRWLCRADAEAYCKWLTKLWGSELEVRLPSKEDLLDPSLDFPLEWEWTQHSLADFDSNFRGGARYHSAYNPETQSLRHRREEDSHDEAIADTGFRVGWGPI